MIDVHLASPLPWPAQSKLQAPSSTTSLLHIPLPNFSVKTTPQKMETMSSLSLPFRNPRQCLRRPPASSLSRPLITPSLLSASLWLKNTPRKLPLHLGTRKERGSSALRPSSADSPALDTFERWILQPIGDGNYRHIGYKVPLPGAFEISSNTVTVGRVSEKADLVIPVATVSGLHARLEKKDEALLVTDLGSTNGTFIDDKKLTPGVAASASPGSCITFGDKYLAIFRVSKIEASEPSSTVDESATKVESNLPSI